MVADAYHAGRFDVTGALICLAAVAVSNAAGTGQATGRHLTGSW